MLVAAGAAAWLAGARWRVVGGVVEVTMRGGRRRRAWLDRRAFTAITLGHVVLAWLWLDQALATVAEDGTVRDEAFYRGKRAATQYFFTYELPKAHTEFDLLARLDRTTLDLDTAVL